MKEITIGERVRAFRCKQICSRSFCNEIHCLHQSDIYEINRDEFENHVNVLREYSYNGRVVSHLYELISIMKKEHDQIAKEAKAVEKFDPKNPKTFTMDGVLITTR